MLIFGMLKVHIRGRQPTAPAPDPTGQAKSTGP